MASVPLVALAGKPVEAPDVMGQYGKLVALKSMLQNQQFAQQNQQFQQQLQPLKLQEAQNTVKDQQRVIADRDATTQAMLKWDGKDPSQLEQNVLHLGGSSDAAMNLSKHFLDVRKETEETVKNEGEGQVAKANAQKLQYEQTAGQINSFANLPDDQLPQALLDTAQHLDPQHAQGLQAAAQLPPAQLRQTLPAIANGFLGYSAQTEAGLKQAEAAQKQAEIPKVQAEAAMAAAKQQEMAASGLTPSQFEAKAAGAKAGAEAKAKFPYESSLVAVRQQVENQFWNNKDAIGKVEQNVVKPFSDQQTAIAQLNSALDQAAAGNSAAAQAVLPKLVGISQPVGSRRYNQAEAHQLAQQGNIPQRFESTILKAVNGEQWTPQMISDMRELAKAQSDVSVRSANAQIDNINTLHHTTIGHVDASAPTSSNVAAPEGTVIKMPDGSHQVKKNGKWEPQP